MMAGKRRGAMVTTALLAVGLLLPATSATAAVPEAPNQDQDSGQQREYIVRAPDGKSTRTALRRSPHVPDEQQVRSIGGAATQAEVVRLHPHQAAALASDGDVLVEPNFPVSAHVMSQPAASSQRPAASTVNLAGQAVPTPRTTIAWGLDRSDQPTGLNGSYAPPGDGAGVHAYIVDGSILTSHPEFAGRIGSGASFVNAPSGGECDQHGTHVAGIVGSSLYGMANAVTLHPVRVLDCQNNGDAAGVLQGMDWILQDMAANGYPPTVVNLSIGGEGDSAALQAAIDRLVATGAVVVASAGNQSRDACTASPANAPNAITVGATNRDDSEADYSNWGTCLDLFAPGTGIAATSYTGNVGEYVVLGGTSQSAPHVSGAAAVYLGLNPTASPAQVRAAITDLATPGVVALLRPSVGSPNRLVAVAGFAAGAPIADPTVGTLPPEEDPGAFEEATESKPAKVKRLRVKQRTSSRITVKYRMVPDAKKYRFWVKQAGSKKWRSKGSTREGRKVIKNLDSGTTYTIKVRAKNSAGLSKGSTIKARTKT